MDKKILIEDENKTLRGVLKVHDIFNPIPDFMRVADCFVSDPPCSLGNLNSFYTKADLFHRDEYIDFANHFFNVVHELKPKTIFVEVFKSNFDFFKEKIIEIFGDVKTIESTYYHNKKNKCWFLCSGEISFDTDKLNFVDEEDIIFKIGEMQKSSVLCDPCMGKGLVAKSALAANKNFVGTELNKKRLGVLLNDLHTNYTIKYE